MSDQHRFTLRMTPAEDIRSPQLPPPGHFINGEFVPGGSGETSDVVNPATGEVISQVLAGGPEDVDLAVSAARQAQRSWRNSTPQQRSDLLYRIAEALQENQELFQDLESLNTGKPDATAEDDVVSAIDTFRFAAGAARTLTSLAAGDYVEGHTSVILREPVGVVGVITPWNYPLLMAAWKIGPLLAAGNSIVLKPSEQTPLTTLKFAEFVAAILPPGVLNIITGYGATVGQSISEHPGIDLVAITGSVGSGVNVAEAASKGPKRVHLELGGKAPVIVFPDADLKAAAQGVREAGFWNAGQECGAACRVLVHESVADEFTQELARLVSEMVIGGPWTGPDTELGPMISREHFDRVRSALERVVSSGQTIAVGGSVIDGPGFYIEPTVVTGVQPGDEIASTELFGPIVSIETFAEEDEAFRRANETQYGLAASIWTGDAKRSVYGPRELDFGTVWVNSHLVLANEVPWGGFKGSGYGRDLSLYALDDFSRTKHVMTNHSA